MFSARSEVGGPPNAVSRALLERERRGLPVQDLTVANPTRAGFAPSAEQLADAMAQPAATRYAPESLGLAVAREAVGQDLQRRGTPCAAEDILLTASTSEAYSLLFKLLCNPGDAVLVPAPSYPLLHTLAHLEQVRLVPYPLGYDGRWYIDVAAVEAAARTHGARAVVVVSPNNPTGSYLKRQELQGLHRLGLPIVADEVFADYALHPEAEQCGALQEQGPLTFRLGGLSKQAALPQLKLAWCAMAGPPSARRAARERLEHMADAFLSPNSVVQHALPVLLEAAPRRQAAILERCRHNLAHLQAELRRADGPCDVLHVEGGWYAVLRLPETRTDEQWCLQLLGEGIRTQPGYFYDFASGAYLVLSLLTDTPVWEPSVARLVDHVGACD